jgi:hypothetical protein
LPDRPERIVLFAYRQLLAVVYFWPSCRASPAATTRWRNFYLEKSKVVRISSNRIADRRLYLTWRSKSIRNWIDATRWPSTFNPVRAHSFTFSFYLCAIFRDDSLHYKSGWRDAKTIRNHCAIDSY